MLIFSIIIYVYAGVTCAWHLWQLESVGVAINNMSDKNSVTITAVLRELPIVLLVIVLVWPIIFPWQAFREIF